MSFCVKRFSEYSAHIFPFRAEQIQLQKPVNTVNVTARLRDPVENLFGHRTSADFLNSDS